MNVEIIGVEPHEKGTKVIFDYFGKVRYTILSPQNLDRLNNNKKGLQIKEGLIVGIVRTIKPSYFNQGTVELFRISSLVRMANGKEI